MTIIVTIFNEILVFFNEVSIYLIFGFFVAGVLHVIFPESLIRRHLGKNTFGSVIKATLFGIPLPLCSCGVVPVAASLKKSGASKGACISFLIATPQVGADSFLITYSLLGWIFGLFRIVASLITAAAAGILVNIIARSDNDRPEDNLLPLVRSETVIDRLKSIFGYIEYELLGSIANALVAGIIIAGVISAILPDDFFAHYLGNPFLSMILMMAVGIPLYVCAAASTPIAASLVMKGISPGAALVFLLTGPATNLITIAMVIRTLGKKAAAVYLASIAVVSLALGYLLNIIIAEYGFNKIIMTHQHEMLPPWLMISGSVTMAAMLIWYYFKLKILDRFNGVKPMDKNNIRLNVEGMTCMHCAGNVKKAVEAVQGTSDVTVNLNGKYVEFQMDNTVDTEAVKAAITQAGYTIP